MDNTVTCIHTESSVASGRLLHTDTHSLPVAHRHRIVSPSLSTIGIGSTTCVPYRTLYNDENQYLVSRFQVLATIFKRIRVTINIKSTKNKMGLVYDYISILTSKLQPICALSRQIFHKNLLLENSEFQCFCNKISDFPALRVHWLSCSDGARVWSVYVAPRRQVNSCFNVPRAGGTIIQGNPTAATVSIDWLIEKSSQIMMQDMQPDTYHNTFVI